MSLDWERLAKAIKRAREEHRMTQKALAAAAGVSESTIQNLESGRSYSRRPDSLPYVEGALHWAPGSIGTVLAGGDPTPTPEEPAPESEELAGGQGRWAEGLTLRVIQEMTEGQVLDSQVLDLTRPGSTSRMVVVLKRGETSATPDEIREDLEEWSRVQRALLGLVATPVPAEPNGDEDEETDAS